MKRIIAFTLLLVTAVTAAAHAATTAPTPSRLLSPPAQKQFAVTPKVGGRHTTFRFTFTAGPKSGISGAQQVQYFVTTSRRGHTPKGCVQQTVQTAVVKRAGQRVTVKLRPPRSRPRGGWCAGRYHGTVTESVQAHCSARMMCPMYVMVPRTLGTYKFRVR